MLYMTHKSCQVCTGRDCESTYDGCVLQSAVYIHCKTKTSRCGYAENGTQLLHQHPCKNCSWPSCLLKNILGSRKALLPIAGVCNPTSSHYARLLIQNNFLPMLIGPHREIRIFSLAEGKSTPGSNLEIIRHIIGFDLRST